MRYDILRSTLIGASLLALAGCAAGRAERPVMHSSSVRKATTLRSADGATMFGAADEAGWLMYVYQNRSDEYERLAGVDR